MTAFRTDEARILHGTRQRHRVRVLQTAAPPPAVSDRLEDEMAAVLFDVEMSLRRHTKRQFEQVALLGPPCV